MESDTAFLDATAQADLVRSGDASPRELVDAAIERIERLNPRLNAVIHERFDRARAEADGDVPDGPFRGVPFVLKDLDGYSAGDPYYGGTKFLRDHDWRPERDTYLTERFRAAGLICVGRTNTPELGLVPTTEPATYGPTRNPWDTERSTGGSSGGSAAAVASGMVPIGHAGDGGGSIRIPASECGLVGLKPTRGRHSLGPEVGESWGGLVARLAVTRSVRDTAALLDAVQGEMPGDPYTAPPPARPYVDELGVDPGALRIGWRLGAPSLASDPHPDVVSAVEGAARLLESLGHRVEESSPAALDDEGFVPYFINAYNAWVARDLDRLGAAVGTPVTADDVEAGTWALAEAGRAVSATDYLAAIEYLHGFTRRVASWWADGFDLLLTATIPEPPPPLGQFSGTPDNPLVGLFRSAEIVPFTAPFNTTGQPAVSLPLHWNADGLPIGVQLVAAAGREDLLVRVASQLEAAAPWADRRPPVHA
ncbi:MAG: amidase [Acidimicrobiales bacterium]|nr:amidase [Acidimicrobiales bacterium]MCB9373893.1 amidase [Microthrixaceae bacterium]